MMEVFTKQDQHIEPVHTDLLTADHLLRSGTPNGAQEHYVNGEHSPTEDEGHEPVDDEIQEQFINGEWVQRPVQEDTNGEEIQELLVNGEWVQSSEQVEDIDDGIQERFINGEWVQGSEDVEEPAAELELKQDSEPELEMEPKPEPEPEPDVQERFVDGEWVQYTPGEDNQQTPDQPSPDPVSEQFVNGEWIHASDELQDDNDEEVQEYMNEEGERNEGERNEKERDEEEERNEEEEEMNELDETQDDDDEDMSDLYSAYKGVLSDATADEQMEPLHTSIVDRMDVITENEDEMEPKTEATIKRFTDSGGSIPDTETPSQESSERIEVHETPDIVPSKLCSSLGSSRMSSGELRSSGEGPPNIGAISTAGLMKPQVIVPSIIPGTKSAFNEQATSGESELNRSGTSTTSSIRSRASARESPASRASAIDSPASHRKTSQSTKYPEFIEECSKKLKQHYASAYAKETPLDWFKSDKKPKHRIFNDFFLTSTQRHETVTHRLDDVIIMSGDRVLVVGDSGYGKTCLTHRILHDYGLDLLPSCTRYKVLLPVDVTLWLPHYTIDDVIKNQIFKENLEIEDNVLTWLRQNSEAIMFVIDGIDRHFEAEGHPIMDLLTRAVYPHSTVLFLSRPRGVHAIKQKCQVVHTIDKLTDKQINDFVGKFFETEQDLSSSLTTNLESDYHEVYRIPLNLSLLCRLAENSVIDVHQQLPQSQTELFHKLFLYTLKRLGSDTTQSINELAFSITGLALNSLHTQTFSLSEADLDNYRIDNQLKDKLLEEGLLEKVACQDVHYFPYRLYQEFLAAKHIALTYFKQINSEQIGITDHSTQNELNQLFRMCWSCDQPNYRFDKICVFVSGLLNKDFHHFVQTMSDTLSSLETEETRERCRTLAFACIRENHHNKNFVSVMADCISEKHEIDMDGEDTDSVIQGVSSMLQADKITSLSLKHCAGDLHFPRLCESIEKSSKLEHLKIDFDGFDQHPQLKRLMDSVIRCSSLRGLCLTMYVDDTSLQSTNTISNIFLKPGSELRSLGVHLLFSGKLTYHEDRPTLAENLDVFERVNIFLSRMTEFLNNTPSLEHLNLNGCFLHKDALPEMSEALIAHPGLRSLQVAGQRHGAPLHREGVLALSHILSNKRFEEVTIDLNSFGGEYKQPREGKKWVRFEGHKNQHIMTRLLSSMQKNEKLRKVRFTCAGLDSDLIDLVSDFIESCTSLKHVELECKELDDLLLLFLGCGVLCSLSVETVCLRGAVNSGSSLVQLISTCLISLTVRDLVLDCQPISTDCVEWLLDTLPALSVPNTHQVTLTLTGHCEHKNSELLNKLRQCAMPLDLLIKVEL